VGVTCNLSIESDAFRNRSLVCSVMGNTQSGYTLTRTAATLDSFISELGPEIVYGERYVPSLLEPRPTSYRWFKVLGRHAF
jgi:hypothetical protein